MGPEAVGVCPQVSHSPWLRGHLHSASQSYGSGAPHAVLGTQGFPSEPCPVASSKRERLAMSLHPLWERVCVRARAHGHGCDVGVWQEQQRRARWMGADGGAALKV